MRWLRAPLLHFLLGGAILYAVVHATPRAAGERQEVAGPIMISGEDVARLREAYLRETGLPPAAADEIALVDRAIEEELLFREALARGLDRNDRSVRNWLVEQMRAVTDDHEGDADELYAQAQALQLDRKDLVVRRILVQKMRLLASQAGEQGPSDAELAGFYAEHASEYRQPGRVSFWHLFVGGEGDGRVAAERAQRIVAELRARTQEPAAALRQGDSFPLAPHLTLQPRPQIEKLFGPAFADALERLEPGVWQGPVVSAYGQHLVWIEAREASGVPPLSAVRAQVLERWREESRARRLAGLVRELRARAQLEVESAAWQEQRHS